MVTTHRFGCFRIIHVNHHRREPSFDRRLHLLIRPDIALHDSTGDAPLASEEDDNGLAGLGGLLLSRAVVFGPSDVVGGGVEVVPYPDEGDRDGGKPEPAPKVELGSMGP